MTAKGIITAEVGTAAIGFAVFAIMYARVTWRRRPEGRHLMITSLTLAALLTFWFVHRAVPGGLPAWSWAIALLPLPIVAWWRVLLFWRAQHGERPVNDVRTDADA